MIQFLALLQESESSASGLATVDQVGLGLLALFSLLGVWRGLWWQVMRLLGLGAAVMIARTFSPKLGPHIESLGEIGDGIAQGIAWVVLFVVALTVAALIGRLGKKSLEVMQLGLMDRVGGLLAGAVTGLVLFTSALVGVSYFAPDWTAAQLSDTYSAVLLKQVSEHKPVLMDRKAAERFKQSLDAAPSRPASGSEDEAPRSDGPSVR
jgi:uncharacterized membrane protein required for colicin V production